ncbi:hypothetical protein E3Q00_03588 [Wallemia mellicola]|nr:hypothetical protein E3Q00_03588 [Wallemia mellicola]
MIQNLGFIILLSAIVLLGTLYSVYYDTFQDTSSAVSFAKSATYFATKKNIFNKLFVKKAWGWTTASVLALLVSAPHDERTTNKRWRIVTVSRWVAATSSWFLFTNWFFGDSLLHRIWLITGAQCVREEDNLEGTPATPLLVPVNHLECYPQPLNSADISAPLKAAKWVGGHDVSGHTFLLMLSAYVIFVTLKPCYSHLIRVNSVKDEKAPLQSGLSILHKVAVYFSIALLLLWIWMLLVTCVYFHTPYEKFTGLLTGYMSIFTVSLIN